MRENVNDLVKNFVNEMFEAAEKATAPMTYGQVKPLTPQEKIDLEKRIREMNLAERARQQAYNLTHKTNYSLSIRCPKCHKRFTDINYETDICYIERHIEECVGDCTMCDSFNSGERCADCYMYDLWKEKEATTNEQADIHG